MMAEAVGPNGRVLAFEPDPRIFETKLVPMQKLYPWISLHAVALSDHSGTERFYLDESTALSSFDIRPHQNMRVVGEINVEVTTLDDVAEAQAIRDLPFMKIDAEGAELHVIKGATRTMEKYRPLIMMELDWSHAFKMNPARYAAGEHERETQSFLAWLKVLGGEYLALNFFGDPIERYDPQAWNIALVPNDFGAMDDLKQLFLSAGQRFFAENRAWTPY
jgi:FkbM family methyltransferase